MHFASYHPRTFERPHRRLKVLVVEAVMILVVELQLQVKVTTVVMQQLLI